MAMVPRSGRKQDRRVGLEVGRGFREEAKRTQSYLNSVLFDTPPEKTFLLYNLEEKAAVATLNTTFIIIFRSPTTPPPLMTSQTSSPLSKTTFSNGISLPWYLCFFTIIDASIGRSILESAVFFRLFIYFFCVLRTLLFCSLNMARRMRD